MKGCIRSSSADARLEGARGGWSMTMRGGRIGRPILILGNEDE
jgi:hypothetical protein